MGRPRNPTPPHDPMPWEAKAVTDKIDAILASVEAPPLDAEVRRMLARQFYRREKHFGGDKGETTLLLRTILESTNGADALVEPIVSAVSSCMRPEWTAKGLAWIECFDQINLVALLATVRDLFGERDLHQHYSTALRRKIAAILEPAVSRQQQVAQVALPSKPPLAVSRIPAIERAISLGKELLTLRASIVCNKEFGRRLRKLGIDQITATEAMRAARVYGERPEIFRRLSWIALFELSSPKMSQSVRKAMEARILAGENITGKMIRKARGRLKGGSLKRHTNQPSRMAA